MHRRLTAPLLFWMVAASNFAVHAAEPGQPFPNRPVRLITGSFGSSSDYIDARSLHRFPGKRDQQVG